MSDFSDRLAALMRSNAEPNGSDEPTKNTPAADTGSDVPDREPVAAPAPPSPTTPVMGSPAAAPAAPPSGATSAPQLTTPGGNHRERSSTAAAPATVRAPSTMPEKRGPSTGRFDDLKESVH